MSSSFYQSLIIVYLIVRRVLQITRRAGVPLIINDRVDVAMAIGAGTVLLPSYYCC
jgi:thiamine monophosphate synthase